MDFQFAQVLQMVQVQQAQLAKLSARLAGLHDEHKALCECLAASGAVPSERLLAWLHRRRFAGALRKHPFASHESLDTIAQAKELILTIAARAGLPCVGALGAVSRALRAGIASAAPELISLFPVTLFAVGGEAGGSALASVEVYDARANVWLPGVPLRTPRSGCAAVALHGQIYVVGGCSADGEDLSSVERLDPDILQWERLPPMHAGRDELAAAAVAGCLYAVGGSHLVWPVRHVIDTVECFVPAANMWERLPCLSRERCAAASVTVDGTMYVVGGCDEDGAALDSAEYYNVSAGRWEALPSMRRPRCNFAAAVVSGQVYVAGGYDDRMRDLDDVERLVPGSTMWEPVAALAVPRWGVRAVSRFGAVYVVGGQAHDEEVGTVDELDPSCCMWVALAPLRTARRSFGLAACYG